MSLSTPLNMLRRNDQQPEMDMTTQPVHSDSQLVEDILKEMGESPSLEQQSNINSQALQYTMDSSQVPPTKYTPPQQNQQQMDYNNYSQKLYEQQNLGNSGFLGQLGFSLNGESLKDKLVKNIKYPILVFVICFLISLPEFNRFLFGFFPRLLLESGQVSIGGVMLKALVSMILFSIIALFL